MQLSASGGQHLSVAFRAPAAFESNSQQLSTSQQVCTGGSSVRAQMGSSHWGVGGGNSPVPTQRAGCAPAAMRVGGLYAAGSVHPPSQARACSCLPQDTRKNHNQTAPLVGLRDSCHLCRVLPRSRAPGSWPEGPRLIAAGWGLPLRLWAVIMEELLLVPGII